MEIKISATAFQEIHEVAMKTKFYYGSPARYQDMKYWIKKSLIVLFVTNWSRFRTNINILGLFIHRFFDLNNNYYQKVYVTSTNKVTILHPTFSWSPNQTKIQQISIHTFVNHWPIDHTHHLYAWPTFFSYFAKLVSIRVWQPSSDG